MKRLILPLLLLASVLHAAAQSPRYNHFREVRDAQDTTAMKSILDEWEQEEPERYAAWAGYCSVMAELTGDPEWNTRGLQWANDGLAAFPEDILLLHKKAEAQVATGQPEDALRIYLRICKLDDPAEDAWFYLTQFYATKMDLASARVYAEKLSHSEDEDFRSFGTEVVRSIDAWKKEFEEARLTPDFRALRSFARTPDFQNLRDRFQACDTTLTVREVSDLYYANGFRSNPDAASQRVSASLRPLLNEQKYQEAFDLLVKSLETEPLSMDVLLSAALLCEPLGLDGDTAWRLLWKLGMLEAALSVSGTGMTEEDPVYVNGVQDEYTFLQAVYRMQDLLHQSLTDSQKDCMIFVNGDNMEQTVYFSLSPAYWERLESMFSYDD